MRFLIDENFPGSAVAAQEAAMPQTDFTLFETAVGTCGITWSARGIQLPESDAARTRGRLLHRFPEACEAAPPPRIQAVIEAIAALLRGEPADDLSGAALDLAGVPAFHRRVYEAARKIRPGATCTYGEIAVQLGDPTAARAVGQALGRNPFAIIVPCHRVLAAGGRVGGFSAHGGITTKRRILAIESRLARTEPDLFSRS